MCGHLAHFHAEEWWMQIAFDAIWISLLLISVVLGFLSRNGRCYRIAAIGLVLLLSRGLLHSGGGYCMLFPELPALVTGVVLALRHFVLIWMSHFPGHGKAIHEFLNPPEPNAPSPGGTQPERAASESRTPGG